jgi:hypothetical protein
MAPLERSLRLSRQGAVLFAAALSSACVGDGGSDDGGNRHAAAVLVDLSVATWKRITAAVADRVDRPIETYL